MTDNSLFYVYQWVDPRNNEVFYVGKGKGKRAYATYEKHRNAFFTRKRKSIERDGFSPIVEIIHDNLLEEEAFEIENFLISELPRH